MQDGKVQELINDENIHTPYGNLELHDSIYPDLNLDRSGIKEFISKFDHLNTIYQD